MADVTHLIAFRDGSYKKIKNPKDWKHTTWLHYTKQDENVIRINLTNVNYIEELTDG